MTPEPEPRAPRPLSQGLDGGPIAGYQIVERLGHGGMGAVYKARQLNLGGRIVALKIIRRSLSRNEAYIRRLQREARIVGGLDHPHIVKGIDLGESSGFHYFVMEYVEGETLRSMLQNGRVFSEEETIHIGEQLASAIDYYGQRGIVHRDVKPGNVVLTSDGISKLMDLGLAKGPEDSALTRSGATIGTPQYLSPEQAQNPRGADVRSDLYSLGATLYHMATGQPPFQGETVAEVLTKVLFGRRAPAAEVNPAVSERFSHLLERLMDRDPRRRYQSAAELLRDIRAVRAGREPEPPPAVGGVRLDRRRTLALAASAIVMLIALAGVLIVWVTQEGARDSASQIGEREPGIDLSLEAFREIDEASLDREARAIPPRLARLDALIERYPGSAGASLARAARDELLGAVSAEAARATEGSRREAEDRRRSGGVASALEAFTTRWRRHMTSQFGDGADRSSSSLKRAFEERLASDFEAYRAEIARLGVLTLARAIEDVGEAADFERAQRAIDLATASLESYRPALSRADTERFESEIERAGVEARESCSIVPRREIEEAVSLAMEGRALQARGRLETLATSHPLALLGLTEALADALRIVAEAVTAADAAARAAFDRELPEVRCRVARRDYDGAVQALDRLEKDLAAAGEGDLARSLAQDAAWEAADLAAIRSLWQRVRESLVGEVGLEIDLPLGGDRNRKKLLAVEGNRLRYSYPSTPNGPRPIEKEESLYALDRSAAVARMGTSRGALRALAAFLVAESEAAKPRDARDLLEQAESHAASAEDASGRLAARIAEARARLERTEVEKREESRQLLAEADAAFDARRYAEARERYVLLRDGAAHREVYGVERARVDERIDRCDSQLQVERLRQQFHGSVALLDERAGRIRLVWDWSDAAQLRDFEFNEKYWRVESGRLINEDEKPPDKENLFKHRIGLRFPATFNVFADFVAEFDYYPSPEPFFFAVSCFGNCIGVLSKLRQANCWRGDLGDYEAAFHLEGRKLSRPAGIADFRFEGGERHRVRIEIKAKATRLRFAVDGVTVIDRELTLPQQTGGFEIRTWIPDAYGALTLEGILKRP